MARINGRVSKHAGSLPLVYISPRGTSCSQILFFFFFFFFLPKNLRSICTAFRESKILHARTCMCTYVFGQAVQRELKNSSPSPSENDQRPERVGASSNITSTCFKSFFYGERGLNIRRSCRFGDSLLIVSSCASRDREHVPLITSRSAKQRYFMRRLLVPCDAIASVGAEFLTLITPAKTARKPAVLSALIPLSLRGPLFLH